jgi:ABC-type nitrate/sulfonate/bicarbonate transport system substrate-binding protein
MRGPYEVSIATAQVELTGNIVFTNPEPFQKEGLRIRLMSPGTGPAIVESLLKGDASYANVLAGPLMAAVRGAPLKVILTYQNRGWELWARPEIVTLRDLIGKTIAQTSPLAQKYLDRALQQQGIDPQAVRTGKPAFSPQAIVDGHVDAALLLPPMTAEAQQVGLRRILRLGDIGDVPTFGLVTTDQRLQEHPDEITRLVRAAVSSIKQLREDRALGLELAKKLGTASELAEMALDETLAHLDPSGELAHEWQQQWIQIACEVTGTQSSVPLSQVFNFDILREVRGG